MAKNKDKDKDKDSGVYRIVDVVGVSTVSWKMPPGVQSRRAGSGFLNRAISGISA
jgi:hypothetical protein